MSQDQSTNTKKLFIIDAMASFYRSFHAMTKSELKRPSDNLPCGALYGCALFLLRLIEEHDPDYIAVASDSKAKTFRHKTFIDYKAHRKPMPEELVNQLPYLSELFAAFGLDLIKQDGYEADDIIACISKQSNKKDPQLEIYIISGDKDFCQLVDERTFLFAPKKGGQFEKFTPTEVFNKFSCRPEQIIDLLAIMGDSSDNIPGVAGIGPKGASKLLQQFNDLDGIYKNLAAVSNKRIHKLLKEQQQQAYLSQDLVRLCESVPVAENFTLSPFREKLRQNLANKKIANFFLDFEFKSLANRAMILEKKLGVQTHTPTPSTNKAQLQASSNDQHKDLVEKTSTEDKKNRNYILLDSLELFETVRAQIQKSPSVYLSTVAEQGSSTANTQASLCGISFSDKKNLAYFIPLHQSAQISPQLLKDFIFELIANPTNELIVHDLATCIKDLSSLGIDLEAVRTDSNKKIFDLQIASYLLEAGEKDYSLDRLSQKYLNIKKTTTSSFSTNSKLSSQDPDLLSYYACEQADLGFRLYHEAIVTKLSQQGLADLYFKIESPLALLLLEMQTRGISVDQKQLQQIQASTHTRLLSLHAKLIAYSRPEAQLNPKSSKQLTQLLFDELKLHKSPKLTGQLQKTKSGLYSTDQQNLRLLKDTHPIITLLLEYRHLSKLQGTYIEPLLAGSSKQGSRIHTRFAQTATATGRLSSLAPNLQNIPIKTPLGKEIRKSFVAQSSDYVLISCDYSQIELRILAHMSKDPLLQEAFFNNRDIHQESAARIFALPFEQVSEQQRRQAKIINYGIIYGMSAKKLALETSLSNKEAQEFIDHYFASFPQIKLLLSELKQSAQRLGFAKTLWGRKRYLYTQDQTDIASLERLAVNTPIQGSAADLIKKAMLNITAILEKHSLDCHMLLQVHDELVFECHKSSLAQAVKIVQEQMQTAAQLSVPLQAQINWGDNWLEAHP
jgi:DNA polymerase I